MKPKFYKVELVDISSDIMFYAYPANHTRPTLEERLPEGKCDSCGGQEWMLLPKKSQIVREGGKPYIECLTCGTVTHL